MRSNDPCSVPDHVWDCLGGGFLLLLVGLGEDLSSGNRRQFNELGENVMFIGVGALRPVDGNFNSMQ